MPAVVIDGEQIPFLIEEKVDRSDNALTKADLAESPRRRRPIRQARRQLPRHRQTRRYTYLVSRL